MEGELLDWELVHGTDTESTDSIISEKKSGSSSVIDDGMILSDHFSADNLINIPAETTDQSLDSGDSSRVVYGSESPNRSHNPVVVSAELGFDESGDDCDRTELGFSDSEIGTSGDGEIRVSDFEAADEKLVVQREAVSESTGGTVSHYEDGHFSESDHLEVADGRRHVESQSVVEQPIEDSSKSWSHSGGNELVSGDTGTGIVNGEDDIVSDSEAVEKSGGNTVDSSVRSGDVSKSRETVWWKMPFVLVKYCALRIGPVWSVSMAAALMGLVLLGRRLYNMKKKAQSFHLKVAIDDKKVSRVVSQAARLNEAFTEVRRVPVIRPALPFPGAWPVLSLR